MITDRVNETINGVTIKIPVMHTVLFSGKITDYDEINEWCTKNCKHPFYLSMVRHSPPLAQFEDDRDAMLFALRWK